MARLISIKLIRSPSNIEGCYQVFVHRPVPIRAQTLAGTKKMNCPSEKMDLFSLQQQARGSDALHHHCITVLFLAPVVIMFGFLILVAKYR
jgi:hypothetical protein